MTFSGEGRRSEMRMPEVQIQEHARQLFEALGPRAVAKAAQEA